MTVAEKIRELKRLHPPATAPQLVLWLASVGVTATLRQVHSALRSKSSRRGPARHPASCSACGARPCHQRGAR